MQKYLLLCFFIRVCLLSTGQTTALKDSAIQISNLKIKVSSSSYSATTIVELELSNPNNKLLDGEINFSLADGQAINDFKLDINGHMRDGVVIEKQKARVAYENVVRQKVDPGLLEMTSANQYRIRVYPVPVNGKRSVSFSVQQLLIPNGQQLDYVFPINFSNPVRNLSTDISVVSEEMPFTTGGLLQGQAFRTGNSKHLVYQTQTVLSKGLLVFSIPLKQPISICRFDEECGRSFFARITPDSLPIAKSAPLSVTVFWDVSASAENRSLEKEINFLEDYLKTYAPQQLTIVTFAIDVVEAKKFSLPATSMKAIKRFLEAQKPDGATRLNRLYCSHYPADEYLLFSDGQNTFGEGEIHTNNKPVFCIQSSVSANTMLLNKMAAATAGKLIKLSLISPGEALTSLQQPQWKWLQKKNEEKLFELQCIEAGNSFFVTGKNNSNADSLVLNFEYAEQRQKVVLYLKGPTCEDSLLHTSSIIEWQSGMRNVRNADSLHALAIDQNIVTATTSLIVLDALEDYFQYKVTPPKELLAEFQKLYPSLPDKKEEKKKEQEILVYQKLKETVSEYNEKINWWDPHMAALSLKPLGEKPKPFIASNRDAILNTEAKNNPMVSKQSAALSEVVVVGYASTRRRSMSSSVSGISASELSTSTTLETALQGRIAGLNISGQPGASRDVAIRGTASIRGGGEPLYILDGVRIDAPIALNMSTFDIENISVLKDASATAMYGSGAANRVIVITTKRGRFTPQTKPEAEDEKEKLTDSLKELTVPMRYEKYLMMKLPQKDIPAFYFQMADYFLQKKQAKEALRILSNLAEIRAEDHQLLRTIGYVLEEWSDYANAVEVYKAVLKIKEEEPQSYRDLALAYAMNGNATEAIDLLYKVLGKDWGLYEDRYHGLREIMMTELNTILHAGLAKSLAVDKSLVQLLPVDLRVVVDWNKDETDIDLHVIEPGGEECYYSHQATKSGGRITKDFTQGYGPEEYEVKQAKKGTYKITIDYFGDLYQKQQVPSFVKLSIFKNYGKPNQTIFIKAVKLEGEERMVDLAEIKF
jgi:TonB-dependent SusC/RagA subfamily outer membrane receptor